MENLELLHCDQCKSAFTDEPVQDIDHDEWVFCSDACYESFFEQKSAEQDAKWEA